MLETLALMGHGFVNAMSLSNLLFMAGGTAIGIIIGCPACPPPWALRCCCP